MEDHRTPYLGRLTDAALLPHYQESQGNPNDEPLPLVGANPAAARKAGNNVSGRVLSVTTNFPVVAGVESKPILRSRRGLSSLTACLDYISDHTEWENINIAWVGEVEGQDETMGLTTHEKRELERLLGDKMIPVWLDGPAWQWREYAEQVLWPTLHYSNNVNDIAVQQAVGYSTYGWSRYIEMNERYAEVVVNQYKEGDIIMIHDMYLFLLPQMIRKTYPDALIGLYVHSPFPSSELFRGLPQREELLYGMLNSTIIGFQSRQYIKHFISAATRLTGIESVGEKLLFDGRYVACAALPFGINVRDVLERSASKEVAEIVKEISEIYTDKKIIVGRDKLDSTQGIIQKLRAFGMMLELFPAWRGRVVFVQITTRTWQFSPRLEQQISQLTSYINGVYGDIHYSPIVHFSRHIDQNEYIALLQCAELGFFTPVREGASSAAVEYVLCQHMHPPSGCSLVLSEFMGISDLLAEGGHSVNPFDSIQVAYALNRALHNGHSERSALEEDNMYKKALEHDVGNFVSQFLSTVVLHDLRHENQHYTPDADVAELVSSYKQAGRRLFLFDYDGTLTPIVRDPAAAVPSERLKKSLKKLSDDPKNVVWIISGRDMGFLDEHLGSFKINLSAEHGCYVKKKAENPDADWEDLVSKLDMSWMKVVLDVLQSYTERTEGAVIERKKSAITWHYRKSDPEFGKFQASHLRAYLELTVANKYPVDVMAGKANVEIRPKLFNKGEIVRSVFEEADSANAFPEFVLCIGDDTTDEDMFRVMSDQNRKGLHTIIVGPQNKLTIAKWHLNNVDKVHEMLDSLADADSS